MKITITLNTTDFWTSSGNGIMTIKNEDTVTLTNWSFNFEPQNFQISKFWSVDFNNNTVVPKTWTATIKPGQTISSGFSYKGSRYFEVNSNTPGVSIISVENAPVLIEPTLDIEEQNLKTNHKIFGYYSEWSIYSRKFFVENIPVNNLTHIVYAFMLPNPSQTDYDILKNNNISTPLPYRPPPGVPEGTLVFHDEYAGNKNIVKLKKLKQDNPHIKIIISIGGWSLSWTFSKIAADITLRKNFIKSSVNFIIQHDFDGIDIDWEFVGKQGIGFNYVDKINDKPNFLQMLKEFREEMDNRSPNKHLELTAATGCNPQVIKNYEGTHQYLDYILLMSYDYSGSWEKYGGHLSSIYHNPSSKMNEENNCNMSVQNTLSIGYPANKICLGCPLYGRGWQKIIPDKPEESKLFGPSVSGAAKTVSGSYGEPGMSSWRDIRNVIKNGEYTLHIDKISKTAYSVDVNGKTWSHDSPETARYKAQYVKEKKLGGFLLWDLSDDTRDGEDNILDAIIDELNTEENQINRLTMEIKEIPITDNTHINEIITAIKNIVDIDTVNYTVT